MGVDDEAPPVWVKWPVWHGSQDLLTRVLRLAVECVADHQRAEAVLPRRLFVDVGADCEEFETIDDFAKHVTSDALRNFSRIQLEVGGHPDLLIRVYFEREGRVLDTGRAGLQVWSGDEAAAKLVERRVRPALDRGCTRVDRAWRAPAGIPVVLGLTLFLEAKLLGLDDSWAAAGVGALVAVFVWLALYALVPAVEIAPPGQSRLERTRGVALGLAIGLIGTGLGKWIYGL